MSIIQEDFRVSYEVLKIGSIKSWDEVKIDGVKYRPSVKIRATNIEEKMDAKVGLREIETIVDFQIHTNTLDEAVLLQEQFRKMRANNQSVHFIGDLPRKEKADDILVIKSIEPLEDFLQRNNITLKTKETKKDK